MAIHQLLLILRAAGGWLTAGQWVTSKKKTHERLQYKSRDTFMQLYKFNLKNKICGVTEYLPS